MDDGRKHYRDRFSFVHACFAGGVCLQQLRLPQIRGRGPGDLVVFETVMEVEAVVGHVVVVVVVIVVAVVVAVVVVVAVGVVVVVVVVVE